MVYINVMGLQSILGVISKFSRLVIAGGLSDFLKLESPDMVSNEVMVELSKIGKREYREDISKYIFARNLI